MVMKIRESRSQPPVPLLPTTRISNYHHFKCRRGLCRNLENLHMRPLFSPGLVNAMSQRDHWVYPLSQLVSQWFSGQFLLVDRQFYCNPAGALLNKEQRSTVYPGGTHRPLVWALFPEQSPLPQAHHCQPCELSHHEGNPQGLPEGNPPGPNNITRSW